MDMRLIDVNTLWWLQSDIPFNETTATPITAMLNG